MGIDIMKENKDNLQYKKARKRVKEMKGFYFHLMIFIIMNTFILVNIYISKSYDNENFWEFKSFFTVLVWGIGLFMHATAVFNHSYLLGKKWEERKIRELLEKENQKK